MSKKSRRRQEQHEEKAWTLGDPGADLFALLTQGAVTATGVAVGPESAMRVPAVAAAVRTIAETIASLPIHLFRRLDGGGRERDREHPAAKVLERPAPWTSAYEFKLRLVLDAIKHGRGIAVAARGDGEVRELHRIAQGLLRVEHDRATGEPSYVFAPNDTQERRYDYRDVVDVVPVPGEAEPPSLISLAREAIGFATILQQHGSRLFANGARPSGLLSFEGNLGATEIRNRVAAWNAAHGGAKSGGTAAMDRKAVYTALALNSVDAQYLELWKHAILEIARVFRLPPHMLGELGRATFSNTEELGLQFIAYTLRPWLDLIEGALTRVLLDDDERQELFLEFVLDDLTRGNIVQRFAALRAAVGGPFICHDLFQYALRCHNDPARDPAFLPILFQADADCDWLDETVWQAVNPGLSEGFPDLDELRAEARIARELPRLREGFKQVHLNIWQDGSAAGWIDMAVYDEAGAAIDLDALRGEPCWIGVDLSKSYDLTAIVAAFLDEAGGFTVLCWAYLPETTFKRRCEELPDLPLRQWREEGRLTVIPGDLIDDDVIEGKLRELCDLYDVREMAFDPKFAAKMIGRLTEDELPAVEVQQRPMVMGPFYSALQKAIIGRRFRHGGHPVLRWCVQNAVPIYGDTGLPYISKKRSTAAIDALVAAAIATGRADADGGERSGFGDDDFDPAWAVGV